MTVAVLVGAAVAAGMWLVASGMRPAREPLAVVLGRVAAPPVDGVDRRSFDAHLGSWLRRIPTIDRAISSMRADLRILRKDPDEQAAAMIAPAVVGFMWGPVVGAGLASVGSPLPIMVPVWLAIFGGVAGAVGPASSVRAQAVRHREAFSNALIVFCELIGMGLAGGKGIKQSIDEAAAAVEGWAFSEIRVALKNGYYDGLSPWDALARLADEAALDDLAELAAALSLAGEEGAAVRTIVRTKAQVIRSRLDAAIERKGGEATEAMAMPALLLAFGFLVFWAYPAFVNLAQA